VKGKKAKTRPLRLLPGTTGASEITGSLRDIKGLSEEVDRTPADVAENLIPISFEDDAEACLESLV